MLHPCRSWKMARSAALAVGLAVGAGADCGGGVGADSAETPTVALPEDGPGPVSARGAGDPPSCTQIVMAAPPAPPPKRRSAERRAELDRWIEAADQAVIDGEFRDVDALVERARLQLLRGGTEANREGANDGERGRKNAQRAVAIDRDHPGAQLVLALSLSQTVASSPALRQPHSRAVALRLVGFASQVALDHADRRVAGALHTLIGMAELDAGDCDRAAHAFNRALAHDPAAAGAWAGRGHLARSRGDLVGAHRAYQRALSLSPGYDPAVRGLDAVGRCEALRLTPARKTAVGLPKLQRAPLAPKPPAPGLCDPTALADRRSQRLCQGRIALGTASTPDGLRRAAHRIIEGWADLQFPCADGDSICGPYVAEAFLEASRAFRSAGELGKSITAARFVLKPSFSGPMPPGLETVVLLELGDAYFTLGLFDRAAGFYERHARQAGRGPMARLSRERAFALRVALGQRDHASSLAKELARDRSLPEPQRAAAVLIAAELIRATQSHAQAGSWLAPHQPLIDAAGLSAEVARITAAPTAKPSPPALLLPGAVDQLLADRSWSAAAVRIAAGTAKR